MQKIDDLEKQPTSITLTNGQKRYAKKIVKKHKLNSISDYVRTLIQKDMNK